MDYQSSSGKAHVKKGLSEYKKVNVRENLSKVEMYQARETGSYIYSSNLNNFGLNLDFKSVILISVGDI